MKKTKQVLIQIPNIARTQFNAKKVIKKNFFPWTSEIIQFIQFENHMDGPRYLKFFLGYAIKYPSFWYFKSHGCFTARQCVKIWICYLNHTFSSHITGANNRELLFFMVVFGMTFIFFFSQFTFFNLYLTFFSLFLLNFYFPLQFGLLFPFSFWTFPPFISFFFNSFSILF